MLGLVEQLFRHVVGKKTIRGNCAPLLADLFLYSYENEFLDKRIREGRRKLAGELHLLCYYIDDRISFSK